MKTVILMIQEHIINTDQNIQNNPIKMTNSQFEFKQTPMN